jgi:hypothetical protein
MLSRHMQNRNFHLRIFVKGGSLQWSNYFEGHFVRQYRKGSHDHEPILPGIVNPNFVYEEHI